MKPNPGLGGKAPADWVASDGDEAVLADAYSEASGVRLSSLGQVFPSLRRVDADLKLARWIGLDTVSPLLRGLESTLAMVDFPAIRAMQKMAEDVARVQSPAILSAFQAVELAKPALALTMSPPMLDAVASIQRSAVPYAELANMKSALATYALSGLDWAAISAVADHGVLALRPFLADVHFREIGMIARSLWVDTFLAPAIASALELIAQFAPLIRAEADAFARWLPAIDASVVAPALASGPAFGVQTHVHSRAALAVTTPGWRAGRSQPAIEAVIEVSAEFTLPIELEVPGTGMTLQEVMERRFPETLKAFKTLAAVRRLPETTNRSEQAGFAFRAALRAFYQEITGKRASNKPQAVRELLAPKLADADVGQFLGASIDLLEGVYKPAAAAVYGGPGDDAFFTLWTVAALSAMGAIIGYWLDMEPSAEA